MWEYSLFLYADFWTFPTMKLFCLYQRSAFSADIFHYTETLLFSSMNSSNSI